MAEHRAFAEGGGPLDGHLGLTVERKGRDWPSEVVWTTGPGPDERHLYRFITVSEGTEGGVPVYRFDRTLEPDEPDPHPSSP
jgi:hypothetical protein